MLFPPMLVLLFSAAVVPKRLMLPGVFEPAAQAAREHTISTTRANANNFFIINPPNIIGTLKVTKEYFTLFLYENQLPNNRKSDPANSVFVQVYAGFRKYDGFLPYYEIFYAEVLGSTETSSAFMGRTFF